MSNEKEMTPKQLLECMDMTMKVANCYLANLAFNAAGLQADDLKKHRNNLIDSAILLQDQVSKFLEDYAEPEEVFDRRRVLEEETARIRKMSAFMKMVFENGRNGHEKQ